LDVVNLEDLSPQKLVGRLAGNPALNLGTPATTAQASARNLEPNPNALVGKPAPDFKLDLLEGGKFELAAHKNTNIVILDFWATWCGPCRAALPILANIAEQYKSKGVILRPIDLREKPETVRDYLTRSELKLKVVLDPEGKTAQLFGVNGIPHTVIIGKDGIIQTVHVGYSPDMKQKFDEELDSLLAERNTTLEDPAQSSN